MTVAARDSGPRARDRGPRRRDAHVRDSARCAPHTRSAFRRPAPPVHPPARRTRPAAPRAGAHLALEEARLLLEGLRLVLHLPNVPRQPLEPLLLPRPTHK